MLQKNEQALNAKPTIIIVVAPTIAMILSASIVSMAGATCPINFINKVTGTIGSIQNGKNGKPTWILSGAWYLTHQSLYIRVMHKFTLDIYFNSTFNMAMLNGSEPHIHAIKDFRLAVSAGHVSTSLARYNGTATVIMNGMPISNVPVSINIMGRVMSLWIDPTKVMNHFGNTPIYGFVTSRLVC